MTVVGVLARKGQSTQGQDQDDAVLVPLSTAKKKLLGTSQANARAVNAILVKVRDASAMKSAEQEIRTLLRQRHHLQPGQDDDFTLRNLSDLFESQEAASRVLSLLLAAIASVSLVVGGIGIMNIMLVSVTERTREIGLRRAVGARRRDILTQFLIEAVAVSLTGGVLGIALGVVGAWAIGYFAGWLAPIQARAVIPAFLFAGAVGVFFGFYPARKASRLEPDRRAPLRVTRGSDTRRAGPRQPDSRPPGTKLGRLSSAGVGDQRDERVPIDDLFLEKPLRQGVERRRFAVNVSRTRASRR